MSTPITEPIAEPMGPPVTMSSVADVTEQIGGARNKVQHEENEEPR